MPIWTVTEIKASLPVQSRKRLAVETVSSFGRVWLLFDGDGSVSVGHWELTAAKGKLDHSIGPRCLDMQPSLCGTTEAVLAHWVLQGFCKKHYEACWIKPGSLAFLLKFKYVVDPKSQSNVSEPGRNFGQTSAGGSETRVVAFIYLTVTHCTATSTATTLQLTSSSSSHRTLLFAHSLTLCHNLLTEMSWRDLLL